MGYTHYFRQTQECPPETWARIVDGFKKLYHNLPEGIVLWHDYDEPSTEPEATADRIWFNGAGEGGHETMVLERTGSGFQFCKTAQKPYDLMVTGLLLVANDYAPGVWEISSDGDAQDWDEVLNWVNTTLFGGYRLPRSIRAA